MKASMDWRFATLRRLRCLYLYTFPVLGLIFGESEQIMQVNADTLLLVGPVQVTSESTKQCWLQLSSDIQR